MFYTENGYCKSKVAIYTDVILSQIYKRGFACMIMYQPYKKYNSNPPTLKIKVPQKTRKFPDNCFNYETYNENSISSTEKFARAH